MHRHPMLSVEVLAVGTGVMSCHARLIAAYVQSG